MIPQLSWYLALSAVLFTIGAVGVLIKRNVISMFMCIELMLNAVNLTFVACASVGVSTIIAFYFAFKSDGALRTMQPVMDHLWTWIQVGAFRADFGLAMDRLSGIYALFVTFVGLLIHIFATGYMRGDDGYYRFFAYLNLFMFAM